MVQEEVRPVAKFLVPDWGDKVDCGIAHRVAIPQEAVRLVAKFLVPDWGDKVDCGIAHRVATPVSQPM